MQLEYVFLTFLKFAKIIIFIYLFIITLLIIVCEMHYLLKNIYSKSIAYLIF